jgi:4-hydroxy-2-oxoheptanedioate aldolase
MPTTTSRRPWPILAITTVAVALLGALTGVPSAQAPVHLNRMIEKLAQGQVAFGVSNEDLSLENARALATADLDWVYIDYEHAPMNFETLRMFLLGMIDKAEAARKGNVQPKVTPIARFAPYAREGNEWAVKQGLDQGLMGAIFNTVETRDQALRNVRSMRYPQRKGSPRMEPVGLRGSGPDNALWFWGVSMPEYVQRADLWPLNPAGDLIAIMMIETAEGVRNVNEIAAVPGVGGFYIGPSDLSNSLGVTPGSPETEAAIQTILKACLAHNVPCGITAGAADMPRRVKEGFRILGAGAIGGGLSAPADAALRAGRAAAN